jgi:hypothetical protein
VIKVVALARTRMVTRVICNTKGMQEPNRLTAHLDRTDSMHDLSIYPVGTVRLEWLQLQVGFISYVSSKLITWDAIGFLSSWHHLSYIGPKKGHDLWSWGSYTSVSPLQFSYPVKIFSNIGLYGANNYTTTEWCLNIEIKSQLRWNFKREQQIQRAEQLANIY